MTCYARGVRAVVLASVMCWAATARSAPEPSGAHPRMLLDAELRAALHAQAAEAHGPVRGAIALCDEARTTDKHDKAIYQAGDWSSTLEACLVAWAATDDPQHAKTALKFFTALLDDLYAVGDHKGGDAAVRRDSGYSIRNLGLATAIAYDWLHDAPGMTEELRAHARGRWKAWLEWFAASGYRAHDPASNYYAGYMIAATTMAIAQGGEAGGDGAALWKLVTDTMWGKEIAPALADNGVLDGGDWPEGWQYGPLSIAELSLGARLMRARGVQVGGVARWLDAVLRRHVYGLSPGDGVFPGGDTEAEVSNVPPNVLTLDAVALGDASPDDKRWARGELSRLQLSDKYYLLFDALAGVGDKPVLPPRSQWPTWYVAAGTGTLFARTRWDDDAMWFVTNCHAAIDTDHRHPDAGNFVLSRGHDDVIADSAPYGTQSTFTTNAPTIAAAGLARTDYGPSQGWWSEKTAFEWTTQRKTGVVAARCNYADQFKNHEQASDIPYALRDFVLVPASDGKAAALVVIDRATSGAAEHPLILNFHTPGKLVLAGDVATAQVGNSKLEIAAIGGSAPTIGVPTAKDCEHAEARGTCDAARFPATYYRQNVAGPDAHVVHVISATDKAAARAGTTPISGDGFAGVALGGLRDAVVVWRTASSGALSYSAPRKPGVIHVVLDAASRDGFATITAKPDGDHCAVQVAPGGSTAASPLIAVLDDKCAVAIDPELAAASAAGTRPSRGQLTPSPRAGCCEAQSAPSSPLAMAVVVLLVLWRQRTRSPRA